MGDLCISFRVCVCVRVALQLVVVYTLFSSFLAFGCVSMVK